MFPSLVLNPFAYCYKLQLHSDSFLAYYLYVHKHIYTSILMYPCMCPYIYLYVKMSYDFMNISVYMEADIYRSTSITYACIHTYVCIYVCMYIDKHAWAYVCFYVHKYAYYRHLYKTI